MSNPAQTLTCRVRIGGMRVRGPNDLRQKNKCRIIRQAVFSKDRIERYLFAMMSEFAVRHIIDSPVGNACPVSVMRKKNKLRVRVHKLLDQPRTGNSVHFDFLPSNPLHTATSLPSLSRIVLVPILRISSLLWVT